MFVFNNLNLSKKIKIFSKKLIVFEILVVCMLYYMN